MRRSLLCASLAAALLFGLAPATFAQRNLEVASKITSSEGRVALVIGNAAYKDSPLANPVNDATDMAQALRESGFKVILKRNAGTREMRQALREFGDELRRAQVGLFYFAGHGVQVKGNNYLVPVGADIQNEAEAEDLSIDANYVLRTMEEAQTKVSIVILDACRNNPFARSFRSSARGLAQMNAATGSLVAFATAPGSVAADGSGRNGLYTQHLLDNLRHGDADILKVFQRTRAAVVKTTGGRQTPWESTSLVGDFYFRPPAAGAQAESAAVVPAPNPQAIEVDFWNSVKGANNAEELNAYLEQYPKGRYAALARARVRALAATPATPAQVASAAPSVAASLPRPAPGSLDGMRPGASFRDCEACPEMVVIPAGSFTMGSPESEAQRSGDEGPQHSVTLAHAFAVGKYAVTFDEWNACASEGGCGGYRPADSGWGRGRRPVINVSWGDARQYVEWLSLKTNKHYRLLSEAEREYIARAGTTTAFSTGDRLNPTQANYDSKVSYAGSPMATNPGKTVPVGNYAPNAFGLYDVHGNVWEWAEDCWNGSYRGAPSDGGAWKVGDCGRHVLRGGSWRNNPLNARSASRSSGSYIAPSFSNRNFNDPSNRSSDYGFRVARTN